MNTIFTRFLPPRQAQDVQGTWRRYYDRWKEMTLGEMDPAMVELVEELRIFTPPAVVLDKQVYSPWIGTGLHGMRQQRGTHTLVITGGETEVCVLAAVSGAVDLGYRVVLVTDALCSSTDETHDATMDVYARRYSMQIEIVTAETVLRHWENV